MGVESFPLMQSVNTYIQVAADYFASTLDGGICHPEQSMAGKANAGICLAGSLSIPDQLHTDQHHPSD